MNISNNLKNKVINNIYILKKITILNIYPILL